MVEPGHSFRYDVALITLGLLAYALASGVNAQVNPPAKKPQTKASKPTSTTEEVNPLTLQRRTVAISLLTSLADEARSFQDQSLRARVQMRAADALWESEAEKARALFRRAWEAAVSADKDSWRRYAEERKRIQSSAEPNRYLQSPPELRSEVMRLIAKRDRALAEEFLEQLTDDVARDTNNPASSNLNPATPQTADPEDPPLAIVQRLQLATQLLEEGDIARAMQFADPALDRVTTRGVLFLSYLREKDMAAADQRFATMWPGQLPIRQRMPLAFPFCLHMCLHRFFTLLFAAMVKTTPASRAKELFLLRTSPRTYDAGFWQAQRKYSCDRRSQLIKIAQSRDGAACTSP